VTNSPWIFRDRQIFQYLTLYKKRYPGL